MVQKKQDASLRKFGLARVGEVPWGTHLCQFYQTKKDLVDILVPYFKAGLEGNEFCMWVTAEPLEVEDAKEAMKKAVPGFAKYLKSGQIEIISYRDWYVKGGAFDCDRVLAGWVSKLNSALKKGYDGLRLTGNTFWLEKKDWKAFTDYEEAVNNVIGKYRMIAVCTYSLDKCNANEIIDVISNHQFALIKRSGKWELIESSQTKRIVEDLQRTEQKFAALYNAMTEGVALHEVVYDKSGKAVDYVILDVNPSFEKITGMSKKQAAGKRASKLYGTGAPPYLDIYAKVAASGKPAAFETYFPPMKKHFNISVISPSKGKFNTIFYDITDSKLAEEALRDSEQRWETTLTSIGDAVIATDVEGNVTFMNRVAEKLTGWKLKEAEKKPLKKVFIIVNEQTRKEADNPVEKVLEKGLIIGLANHTLLVGKDGAEIPIDDSGAPIKDEKGKIIGVVLVFRDVAERRKMEKELNSLAKFPSENPNVVLRVDHEGTISYVNPAGKRAFGKLFGANGGKLPENWRKHVADAFESGKRHLFEEQSNGSTYCLAVAPIVSEGYVNIYGEDATERKKAEEKVAQQAFMLANANDAIIGYTFDQKVTFWNKAAEKLYGYMRKEALGRAGFDLLKPVYVNITRNELLGKLTSVGHVETESNRSTKDGKGLIIEAHVILLKDEAGKPIGYVSVDRDITERKKAEEALQQSVEREHFLADIVRNASVAVGVGYPDGRVGMVNAAFQKLTGYSEEELHSINWGKALTPPEYEEFEKAKLVELSQTKQAVQYEKEYIRKDGARVPVELVVQPFFDDKGNVTHYFSFIRDITKRKENEESLKRQASLIDLSPDAIIVKNPDDTITFWSQGAQKLYGWTKAEAVGQKSRELLRTKFPEPYQEILNQLESNGRWSGEKIHHTKAGEEIIVASRWLASCNVKGQLEEILETNIDITERKKSEDEIRKSEERYRSFIEVTGELGWTTNSEGEVTEDIPSWRSFTGQTFEEVKGSGWAKALHPDDRKETLRAWKQATYDKSKYEIEYRIRRHDGIYRHFMARGVPIFDQNGNISEWVGTCIDITERKKYEKALEESQRDLNRAQAVAKTGSWRLDTQNNVLLWSDETYRMFGIPKETPLTYEKFLSTIHPDDVKYVDARWKAALKGEPYDIEHRIIAYGEIKWVHEKAELEFDDRKNLKGGFGTVTDITEQKIMQQKLEESAVQLEEYANQMESLANERAEKLKDAERLAAIGATAGMVGHDIRNPLQSIIGELYLAKGELIFLPEGDTKDSLKETVTTIEEQVKYINKIVTDLQDYAKPLSPCNEEIALESLIQDVTSTLTIPENVYFSYNLETGFPKFTADAAFMKRILTNLLSNGIQAMPEGGNLTLESKTQNGSVVISVADTGVGIPESAREKLFQPLFTTKSKGQGFGLAVCKRLVEAMNGNITFESEEGKGTKFVVKLPKANDTRTE